MDKYEQNCCQLGRLQGLMTYAERRARIFVLGISTDIVRRVPGRAMELMIQRIQRAQCKVSPKIATLISQRQAEIIGAMDVAEMPSLDHRGHSLQIIMSAHEDRDFEALVARRAKKEVTPANFSPTDFKAISRLLTEHEAEVMAVMEPLGFATYDAHEWLCDRGTASQDDVQRLYGITSAMTADERTEIVNLIVRAAYREMCLVEAADVEDVLNRWCRELGEWEADVGIVGTAIAALSGQEVR